MPSRLHERVIDLEVQKPTTPTLHIPDPTEHQHPHTPFLTHPHPSPSAPTRPPSPPHLHFLSTPFVEIPLRHLDPRRTAALTKVVRGQQTNVRKQLIYFLLGYFFIIVLAIIGWYLAVGGRFGLEPAPSGETEEMDLGT